MAQNNAESYLEKKYSNINNNTAVKDKPLDTQEVIDDLLYTFKEFRQSLSKKDIVKNVLKNQ